MSCEIPATITPVPSALLTPARLAPRIDRLMRVDRPRYERLWAYYRNPMHACAAMTDNSSDRPYRQAQEWGLPARITGQFSSRDGVFGGQTRDDAARKDVVIENDIGWRVETMVDYLFGKPIVISSAAPDPARREQIGELLRLILAHNGGVLFLQQLALIGSVYGFVDVLVKLDHAHHASSACVQDLGQPPACDEPTPDGTGPSTGSEAPASVPTSTETTPGLDDSQAAGQWEMSPVTCSSDLERLARLIRLEIVEPARALPVLDEQDWRVVEAYAQCLDAAPDESTRHTIEQGGWMSRLYRGAARLLNPATLLDKPTTPSVFLEVITPDTWKRYRGARLIASGVNSLGQIPLVHIQNAAMPFSYAGTSDVEPLIPLQDELNTRLSDRAHRISMQSFRMYLGKGIENFAAMPVSPGRMWASSDPDADIVEFGGDANCPSEDSHIADMREAMDKTSGVTPVAAGAIKGRIGRLTSAAALRVTMQSLLARTEKKRTTYGAAVARMCELALAWLDVAGLYRTEPAERRIEISWPSPLPENELERLQEARHKLRLGIDRQVVLRELGY